MDTLGVVQAGIPVFILPGIRSGWTEFIAHITTDQSNNYQSTSLFSNSIGCLFFLSSLKHVSAAPTGVESLHDHFTSPLVERADKGKGKSEDSDGRDITHDGGISDKSPGIGIEFESSGLDFVNEEFALNDAYKSKAKKIKGRKDEHNHWALTVDTTSKSERNVNLAGEYILNGKLIKLGTQDAGKAAEAVSKWWP